MMKLSLLSDFFKLIKVLKINHLILLTFSFIFSILIIFIEMIGISVVPIIIINFLDLQQDVFDNYLFNYLKTLDFEIFLFLIIILFFFKSLFTYFHQVYDFIIFKKIRIFIINAVYQNNLKKDYLKIINSPTSRKIWLIDNAAIFTKLAQSYLTFIKASLLILFISIIILLSNVQFFLNFYIFIFLSIVIFYFFFKSILENVGKKNILYDNEIKKNILESFEGIKNIIIYKKFNFFLKNFNNAVFGKEKNTQKGFIISAFPTSFVEFIAVIFFCSYVYISLNQDIENGNFIYTLGLLSYGSVRILSFIKLAIYNFNVLKEKRYVIELILSELFEKDLNSENNLYLDFDTDLSKKDYVLDVKNLSFRFDSSNKDLFSNLNFKIKSKSFYLLKGSSGSGKSTLLDILMGIIKPGKGQVIYNIKKPRIGYVSQECFIINETIRKNIAFGVPNNDIKDSEIKEKLKLADLYNYVSKLKDGINFKLVSNGLNLSVGQKQRVGIARALYFNPNILFLDEPTSALDSETELEILRTLKELSKFVTIIMVSHKENLDFLGAKTLKLENSNITEIN